MYKISQQRVITFNVNYKNIKIKFWLSDGLLTDINKQFLYIFN